MPTVLLGNIAAQHRIDGEMVELPGNRITAAHIPDTYSHSAMVRTVWHEDGFWREHSTDDPAWVESDDPQLAETLSALFGCPIGRPVDWEVMP